MKNLYLVRGLPGAGKSSIVDALTTAKWDCRHFEADMFMPMPFDPKKLGEAHAECQEHVKSAMCMESTNIFVSNTFTQEWEMEPYYKLAETYGYRVFSLIVENRHGNSSIHNVPEKTMERMRSRFAVSL